MPDIPRSVPLKIWQGSYIQDTWCRATNLENRLCDVPGSWYCPGQRTLHIVIYSFTSYQLPTVIPGNPSAESFVNFAVTCY
jgi:hypothetical protein